MEELGNRAERVRNNEVNPREDNMLKITNDGRKLALDQRLSNPLLPDDPRSKVNACVEEIYRHWEDGKREKADAACVLRPVHTKNRRYIQRVQ